jgi:hypothetical protein
MISVVVLLSGYWIIASAAWDISTPRFVLMTVGAMIMASSGLFA